MTTTTTTMLRKITKREARARYDAGLPIAMAGEPWWFDQPREGHTFTRDDFAGWADSSFDAIHTARSGSRYSYAAPADPAPACSCATHPDGSVTTMLCAAHAETDPCLTMSRVTGRRRAGTIRRGVCTVCGHDSSR
jgi:hypothetical protein